MNRSLRDLHLIAVARFWIALSTQCTTLSSFIEDTFEKVIHVKKSIDPTKLFAEQILWSRNLNFTWSYSWSNWLKVDAIGMGTKPIKHHGIIYVLHKRASVFYHANKTCHWYTKHNLKTCHLKGLLNQTQVRLCVFTMP